MVVQDSSVTAKIYDTTGKQIRTIELGHNQQEIILSLVKLFIGMEEVRMENLYLQELTSIKYRQEIILTSERW